MNFEDSDIKINAGCAVFVTTESLQEESKNIPDNLKVISDIFIFNMHSITKCLLDPIATLI